MIPTAPLSVPLLHQDPSFSPPHYEQVPLQVRIEDGFVKSKDFQTRIASAADSLEIDPANIDSYLPFNAMGHLQRNYDEFISHCQEVPAEWSSGETHLEVYPNWDWGFNAFYSNGHSADMHQAGLYYCMGKDPVLQKPVYSALSAELLAHEEGHAILDRFRPQYNEPGVQNLYSASFHEAFGDVFALLMQVVHGDGESLVQPGVGVGVGVGLSQHNLLSDIGEEVGIGLGHKGYQPQDRPWLRSLLNDFSWVKPQDLPESRDVSADSLTTEPHSYSRIWSGASYQILQRICEAKVERGMEESQALKSAGKELLAVYATLVSQTAPTQKFDFADLSEAFLHAGQLRGGQWNSIFREVLGQRGLLE